MDLKRINGLIKNKEKGILLLLIFKTIKKSVIEKLEGKYYEIDWGKHEDLINKRCIEISAKIIKDGREKPTKEEIIKVINSIRNKCLV